jgi:hypothetical protein
MVKQDEILLNLDVRASDNGLNTGLSILDESVISDAIGREYEQVFLSVPNIAIKSGTSYYLSHNIPNPFNDMTEICFGMPEPGMVYLEVLNSLGEIVAVLVDIEWRNAGNYKVSFNCRICSPGVYTSRIEINTGNKSFRDSHKMIIVR